MDNSTKIILQYVLNKIDDDLPKWRAVQSRDDFQLFINDKGADENVFIINFANQIIENEINLFRTLDYITKVNEFIDLPNFVVNKMIIKLDKDLAEHYKLRYTVIKNRSGNFFLYERFWPDSVEDDSVFIFNINSKKLVRPNFNYNSLFIFGLEYKFNDHCGNSSIEFFKNPFDSILFEIELQGQYENFFPPESAPFVSETKTNYTLKIDKNTCIKINPFKNKIFLNDISGMEIGFLTYSKMKRNISQKPRGPNVSTYYFDVIGGMFINQYYENPAMGSDTQIYIPKINIISGQIIINSRCSCSSRCNCNSFNIIFSDLILEDFSCVNIQYNS